MLTKQPVIDKTGRRALGLELISPPLLVSWRRHRKACPTTLKPFDIVSGATSYCGKTNCVGWFVPDFKWQKLQARPRGWQNRLLPSWSTWLAGALRWRPDLLIFCVENNQDNQRYSSSRLSNTLQIHWALWRMGARRRHRLSDHYFVLACSYAE